MSLKQDLAAGFAEFITNNQTGNIAAKSSEEGISNNYTIKTDKGDNYLNGKGMDLKDLQNGKFYFDSVYYN